MGHMRKSNTILWGVDEICEYVRCPSRHKFDVLMKLGFPAAKVGGQWCAHVDNIEDWFRSGPSDNFLSDP